MLELFESHRSGAECVLMIAVAGVILFFEAECEFWMELGD